MGVIIGMDPHKRSATIEVVNERGVVLSKARFGTDKLGYGDMLAEGRRFPDRVWAVEGCNGIGKHLAHRLVRDGETVLDVPPKLSAQVRVFATGNGRKTDPVDAHSVAIAALYSAGLVRVEVDDDLVVMGMLAVANTLGSRIPLRRFKRTQALVLAVGLLAMMLISMVPVLGPMLLFSALCVSYGAIIRTRVGQRALTGVPVPDDKFISP